MKITALLTDSPQKKEWGLPLIALLFSAALLCRFLYGYYVFFWESDDIYIATGIASLINGTGEDFYRYGPQLGYYRLVQGLTLLLGGDPAIVPLIMITLSVLSGALLPFFALAAFRKELSPFERKLFALFLFANPILWMSARYGNTAMVALPLGVGAIVLLSNRPGPLKEAAAFLFFAFAILVRADSILLGLVVAYLTMRNHDSFIAMVKRATIFVVLLGAFYGSLFLFDPVMIGIYSEVSSHLFNPEFPTIFWEYLLWSFSPIPLMLALWGARDMIRERNPLLLATTLWLLPVFAFYFGSATTPRYFLLAVFPVTLCAVIGFNRLSVELGGKSPEKVRALLLIPAFLHLFVGLGHFTPHSLKNILFKARFMTHDHYMYTGGFLYQAAVAKHFFWTRSFNMPRFGEVEPIGDDLKRLFEEIKKTREDKGKVVIILDGGPAFQYHFLAHGAGVRYLPRSRPKPKHPFIGELRGLLGGKQILTMTSWSRDFQETEIFDVEPGDEFWELGEPTLEKARSKFPRGLEVVPLAQGEGKVTVYRFVDGAKEL